MTTRGRALRRLALWFGAVLGALVFATVAAGVAGLRWNITGSAPLGFYRVVPRPAVVGQLAFVCPPAGPLFDAALTRGYLTVGNCPGGYGPLLKRIEAAHGDIVAMSEAGVSVNGRLLPNSTALKADERGRLLPLGWEGSKQLACDELLLMSTFHQGSFDARYFGAVSRNHVREVVEPVWTW